MIAVSTIDFVGGLVIAASAGVWLVVTGIRERRTVVDPTATADAVEALTFPSAYNRGAVKK